MEVQPMDKITSMIEQMLPALQGMAAPADSPPEEAAPEEATPEEAAAAAPAAPDAEPLPTAPAPPASSAPMALPEGFASGPYSDLSFLGGPANLAEIFAPEAGASPASAGGGGGTPAASPEECDEPTSALTAPDGTAPSAGLDASSTHVPMPSPDPTDSPTGMAGGAPQPEGMEPPG
jgi:hypothetical protein